MPRVTLTRTSSPGPNPAAGVAVTFTAANTTDKERLALTGREIVLVRNTGASSRTYTVTSTEDPYGRTKDITAQTIAAGAVHTLGPFGTTGWAQTDGYLHLEANNAEVEFAVIALP